MFFNVVKFRLGEIVLQKRPAGGHSCGFLGVFSNTYSDLTAKNTYEGYENSGTSMKTARAKGDRLHERVESDSLQACRVQALEGSCIFGEEGLLSYRSWVLTVQCF